jgi:plasmid replication initiation protein
MAAKMEHVVAIGASAGGLEALQALLGRLQEGGNVACLVAQHLAPDHPSQLVELLRRGKDSAYKRQIRRAVAAFDQAMKRQEQLDLYLAGLERQVRPLEVVIEVDVVRGRLAS